MAVEKTRLEILIMLPTGSYGGEDQHGVRPRGSRELGRNQDEIDSTLGLLSDSWIEEKADGTRVARTDDGKALRRAVRLSLSGLRDIPTEEEVRAACREGLLHVTARMVRGRLGPHRRTPARAWETLDGHTLFRYKRAAIIKQARLILLERLAEDGHLGPRAKDRELFEFFEARRQPDGRLPRRQILLKGWRREHPDDRRNEAALGAAYWRARRRLNPAAIGDTLTPKMAEALPHEGPEHAFGQEEVLSLRDRLALTDRQLEYLKLRVDRAPAAALRGFSSRERAAVRKKLEKAAGASEM
jgi:hypothetical protein